MIGLREHFPLVWDKKGRFTFQVELESTKERFAHLPEVFGKRSVMGSNCHDTLKSSLTSLRISTHVFTQKAFYQK